jgi:hypothetical protein
MKVALDQTGDEHLGTRNMGRVLRVIIDLRGPTELVKFSTFAYRGSSHRLKSNMLDINLIWFGYIVRLSQWGEGNILLVQIISSCRRVLRGGVSTLWRGLAFFLSLYMHK